MPAFIFSQVQQLMSRVSITPLILNAIPGELSATKFAQFSDLAERDLSTANFFLFLIMVALFNPPEGLPCFLKHKSGFPHQPFFKKTGNMLQFLY